MVWCYYINDSIPTNTNIEQMYVYASELRKCWHFYILKLLFLSIFCRYIRYFVGTNDMLVGLHVPTNFQIYRQTLTLCKWMCMRASLENFGIFTFLNWYFSQYWYIHQILCRYKWHACRFTCTDKTPKKHYWGGGGGGQLPPCPPPPPLATLKVARCAVLGPCDSGEGCNPAVTPFFAKFSGTWLSRGSYGIHVVITESMWRLRGVHLLGGYGLYAATIRYATRRPRNLPCRPRNCHDVATSDPTPFSRKKSSFRGSNRGQLCTGWPMQKTRNGILPKICGYSNWYQCMR